MFLGGDSLIFEKFKEVFATVLPISILVLFLHLIITPLEGNMFIRFYLGAFFIIFNLFPLHSTKLYWEFLLLPLDQNFSIGTFSI